jgi:hypothetical protein
VGIHCELFGHFIHLFVCAQACAQWRFGAFVARADTNARRGMNTGPSNFSQKALSCGSFARVELKIRRYSVPWGFDSPPGTSNFGFNRLGSLPSSPPGIPGYVPKAERIRRVYRSSKSIPLFFRSKPPPWLAGKRKTFKSARNLRTLRAYATPISGMEPQWRTTPHPRCCSHQKRSSCVPEMAS